MHTTRDPGLKYQFWQRHQTRKEMTEVNKGIKEKERKKNARKTKVI
jgi:hypothetical protein